MREREPNYSVVVLTKRHPDGVKGPRVVKKLVSFLSESPNSTIGGGLGMPFNEAEKIAQEHTNEEGYIPGNGKLMTSRGVIVRVW